MEISRSMVVERISAILNRSLTPQQAYEWVLGVVVAPGYGDFVAEDALATRAMKMLMDINKNPEFSERDLRLLEYYRQCLTGERDFVENTDEADLPRLPAGVADKWAHVLEPEVLTPKQKFLSQLHMGVHVFAGYTLVFNLWRLFQLGGPWSGHRASAVVTFPFFVYGFLLIFPIQMLVETQIFLVILPLSVFLLAAFWSGVFSAMFAAQGFQLGNFLGSLLLGAIPATIVLGLLIYEKYLIKK